MTTTLVRIAATATTVAALTLASAAALAQSTPAGVWKTIDDNTKKEKSLVRIVEQGGVYSGKVEKLLDPDAPKDAVCKDCSDERKNQPILGMTIIRNVKAEPGEKNVYSSGDILDPNNGKVYRVKLTVADDGRKLDVRGYIGTPLFGRTQTWIRAE